MYIQNNKLSEILNQIEADSQLRRMFSSKWHSIVNFLYKNTGLSIAKTTQAGSIAKNTSLYSSDLDVIFCISPDQSRNQIYPKLVESFRNGYGDIATVSQGNTAIHINFNNDIEIDVILLNQRDFDSQYQGIRDIRELNHTQHNAIKLVKYAFEKAGIINSIPGYKIEKVAFSLNYSDLAICVEQILNQLNYDIKRTNRSIYDVVKYLQ